MAATAHSVSPEAVYHRRDPERTALHRAIREHLPAFLAIQDPPSHVARALRRFLECGVLAHGFVRVRCADCKEESLVAFSCKDRGFCPSCTARRAAQTAAHLVDEVLPHAPYRQFVLVIPFDLHHRVSRDPALESKVLSLFVEDLTAHLREVTDTDGFAQPGMVTFIQRFGSTLNLRHHFHLLALDGVYESHGDQPPLVFTRAPSPTPEQLQTLLERVATRVRALIGSAEGEPEPEVQAPLLKVFGAEPSEPAESRLVA